MPLRPHIVCSMSLFDIDLKIKVRRPFFMDNTSLCFISALPVRFAATPPGLRARSITTRIAPDNGQTVNPQNVPKRLRIAANLNINKTTDPNREDDIASKIASLRKQKRLQSQRSSSSPAPVNSNAQPVPTDSAKKSLEINNSEQSNQNVVLNEQNQQTFGTATVQNEINSRVNINETVDPLRQDEIASKIASMHKQKKVQSQSQAIDSKTSYVNAPELELEPQPSLFSQLPDWKKEQVLQSQMEEAESFFNRNVNKENESIISTLPTSTASPDSVLKSATEDALSSVSVEKAGTNITDNDKQQTDVDYKPKVSTWGVFPRPDNISRTYGGGRGIPRGTTDANLRSEAQKKRDQATADRLAKYRASRGIDNETEKAHEDEINSALQKAQQYMLRGDAPLAAKTLEDVTQWVSSPRGSRLGGRVWLALALAFEAIGRRDRAKSIYAELRKNPYDEFALKAKQLRQGFSDMQSLRVDFDEQQSGARGSAPRVIDFSLPDLNVATDKRYETVVFSKGAGSNKERSGQVGLGLNIALLALFASPVLLLVILVVLRH